MDRAGYEHMHGVGEGGCPVMADGCLCVTDACTMRIAFPINAESSLYND